MAHMVNHVATRMRCARIDSRRGERMAGTWKRKSQKVHDESYHKKPHFFYIQGDPGQN